MTEPKQAGMVRSRVDEQNWLFLLNAGFCGQSERFVGSSRNHSIQSIVPNSRLSTLDMLGIGK